MKRWVIRGAIVLLLVGVGVFLKISVFTPTPLSVSVTNVERGRVEETVTNSRAGTVKARQRAKLSPEIGGRVADLPRKGARVRAGDVLLRLHDDTQQAAVQMAKRELAVMEVKRERACLEAARAEREFQRHQQLKARVISCPPTCWTSLKIYRKPPKCRANKAKPKLPALVQPSMKPRRN